MNIKAFRFRDESGSVLIGVGKYIMNQCQHEHPDLESAGFTDCLVTIFFLISII
jgi:hypothetical protein